MYFPELPNLITMHIFVMRISHLKGYIILKFIHRVIYYNARALRTINIREESEKLNIWVAYFNLENEYGNPPEVLKESPSNFIHFLNFLG